jgi:hypothetical protein
VVGRASAAVRVPELMGAHRARRKRYRTRCFCRRSARRCRRPEPLLSVAFRSGQIFAGTARGIVRLQGSNWLTDSTLSKPIHRLAEASGQLWAMGVSGLPSIGRGCLEAHQLAADRRCYRVFVIRRSRWGASSCSPSRVMRLTRPFRPMDRVSRCCERSRIRRPWFVVGQGPLGAIRLRFVWRAGCLHLAVRFGMGLGGRLLPW